MPLLMLLNFNLQLSTTPVQDWFWTNGANITKYRVEAEEEKRQAILEM